MFSSDVIENIPAWFNNGGPGAECIISTRIRLARNLAGHQFPVRASRLERKDIFDEVTEAVKNIPQCKKSTCLNFSDIERVNQQFLYEKAVRPLADLGIVSGLVSRRGTLNPAFIDCTCPVCAS